VGTVQLPEPVAVITTVVFVPPPVLDASVISVLDDPTAKLEDWEMYFWDSGVPTISKLMPSVAYW
jgi:hypothetical protein